MNNNDNNKIASEGGISFAGALTMIFIVLKLCKVINWSWIWVLSPIWISLGLAILLLVIVAIIFAILNK